MNPLMNSEEVAQLLYCSKRVVEEYARTGRLPGAKFGDKWIFPSSLLIEDLLLLGLTIALCLLAIRKALQPLARLTHQLAERSPADLTPLVATQTPAEVRPLADSLNRLFGRLSESRDAQRRFVPNPRPSSLVPRGSAALSPRGSAALFSRRAASLRPDQRERFGNR